MNAISAAPVLAVSHEEVNRPIAPEFERNQLIEHYLPLVDQVVAKLRRSLPPHIEADELHSVGVTGLIAAVERFDPEQLGTFPSYVRLRIRGAILDEMRRLDPCSRLSRTRNREIRVAVQEIEQALGRVPTDQELSTRLQISPTELARWRQAATAPRLVSLDADTDSDTAKGGSLHEAIADDHQECVRETMEKQELVQLLSDRIAVLPEMQKRILALYYFDGLRLSEIAAVFGLTESRICQIQKQAVAKLQAFIRPLVKGSEQVRYA